MFHEEVPSDSRARLLKRLGDRVRRVTRMPPRTAVGGTNKVIAHGYQSGCPGAGWSLLNIHEDSPSSIMNTERAAACPSGEWSDTVRTQDGEHASDDGRHKTPFCR